jgi:hypothetical protein
MKPCLVAVTVAMLFLTAQAVCAEPNVKEGKWEITSTAELKGVGSTPAQTVIQCISKKDVIPQAREDQNCKVTKSNISGDAVTWAIECKRQEGTVEGQGELIYKGETFDGTVRWTVSQPGQEKTEMTQKIQGRRTGECD